MPKTLTIEGRQFEIKGADELGYTEGRTLTAAEARQLFQVRCENIRNNLAKSVKDAVAAGKSDDEIRQTVVDYADNYTFAMPGSGGGRIVRDPLEREIRNIIRENIKAEAGKQGKKLKDIPEETIESIIEANLANAEVVKLAKKRVAEKQKSAGIALEGTGSLVS